MQENNYINQRHLKPVDKNQEKELLDYFNSNPTRWHEFYKDPKNHGYTRGKDIVNERLTKLNVKTVLDVGTGDGTPMLQYLKSGFDVTGIEYAKEPLKIARRQLEENGFNPDKIIFGDLNHDIPNKKFDAVVSIGVLPHVQDQAKTLEIFKNHLSKDGTMLISFRNQAFSLFSLNQYSYEFFTSELIDLESLGEFKEPVDKLLKEKLGMPTTNIEQGILSRFNNPFEIQNLFEGCGMRIKDLHFFHFHAIPPIFEKDNPDLFNKLSYAMEGINDWRGYFMASSFIVEAVIIS